MFILSRGKSKKKFVTSLLIFILDLQKTQTNTFESGMTMNTTIRNAHSISVEAEFGRIDIRRFNHLNLDSV